MSDATDNELLQRFCRNQSDEAFATLVDRYLNLVYSVALRHAGSPHQAEEITQAVFIILARRADSIAPRTILSGWLYNAARLTAANFMRSEFRRARREHEAFMQSTIEEQSPAPVWSDLSPLLDAAMGGLNPVDRDALVLRYFENKSLREVGDALGVAEGAAKKRVNRALEKLRRCFARRGVTAAISIIATEISMHSVQAAPVGMAQTITSAALKGSAAAGSTLTLVKGTLKIMTWLKAKAVAVYGSVAVLAAGASLAVAHHVHLAANENQSRAAQEKLEAERQGGYANVAADPNADKLEAEQREKQLKAQRQQPGQ